MEPKVGVASGMFGVDAGDYGTVTNALAREAKERRERIATAVLAGFASHFSTHGPASEDLRLGSTQTAELPAISAVAWADALIAELDK
jgi:hypothetical protein